MKRAAIYVRVSTDEQKKRGLSVDTQITALQEFCKQNDYTIVNIYNDAGISARKKYTKRPALLQLINDCENGLVDIILFTKLDRWFRSVADYYEVQTHLDNCNIPWRAIWEDYETETSAGVFKVNIMLSVAQAEADRTSERIHSTFEYKRAKGDYMGTAPIGYKKINNHLYIDHDTEHIVRLIFDVYIKTHSTTAVNRKLIAQNVKISKSLIRNVLRSETYCGNAYGVPCEAYISRDTHNEVIKILSDNYRSPAHNHTYYFATLCNCGICGKRMRGMAGYRQGKFYKNYYCTGLDSTIKHDKHISLSELKIEKYLLRELDELIENYNYTVTSTKNDSIDYEKEKQFLENKLARIGIRFEEGDIDVQEYKEKRKAILGEIASLIPKQQNKKITLPENWRDTYQALDETHKQMFWFSILKNIVINGDGVQFIDFK